MSNLLTQICQYIVNIYKWHSFVASHLGLWPPVVTCTNPPLSQIFPGLVVMSSTHLHSHCTLQHPLSHSHTFPASTFPPTCHCMHPCAFTLIHEHHTCSLPALPHVMHTPCPDITDAAQPPHICPNELSLHSTHQTLILAVKHCCMLWLPQYLFWEHVPHGSLPPDSFRCIQTALQVISTCPQHCAELPMHFTICI